MVLNVVLGVVRTVADPHAASLEHGYRWTVNPRNEGGAAAAERCRTSG